MAFGIMPTSPFSSSVFARIPHSASALEVPQPAFLSFAIDFQLPDSNRLERKQAVLVHVKVRREVAI